MGVVAREVLGSALHASLEADLSREFDGAQTAIAAWRAQELDDVSAIAMDPELRAAVSRGRAGAEATRARLEALIASEPEALGFAVSATRAELDVAVGTWLPERWHEAALREAGVARSSATITRIDGTVVDLIRVPLKVSGESALLLAAMNPLLEPHLMAERADGDFALLDENGAVLIGSTAALELAPRLGLAQSTNRDGRNFIALRKNVANTPWQLVIARPLLPVPTATIWNVVLASTLIAVGAGALAFVAGAWRLRPLLELADGAHSLAAGDFAVRVSISGKEDEIQLLTKSFNEMAGQLESQRSALEQRHQELLRANEVLEQLSITDGLTHLHNHRHFHDQFSREVKRADRSTQPLCLMLIDIDDFKSLNDSYGHAAGDCVLAVAAQLMNSQVRESDYLARYGGEEFAMLLPQTRLEGAVALAEKIRAVLSQHGFALPDSEECVRLTVSIGIAQHATTPDATFDAADRALYEAKAAGKDCVIVSQAVGRPMPPSRRRR
ncbi:MAG TPA: diguanylate cyclase [Myxococcota bacterium]|jgi:diguanylate cyclase (GGDEF)-like protein